MYYFNLRPRWVCLYYTCLRPPVCLSSCGRMDQFTSCFFSFLRSPAMQERTTWSALNGLPDVLNTVHYQLVTTDRITLSFFYREFHAIHPLLAPSLIGFVRRVKAMHAVVGHPKDSCFIDRVGSNRSECLILPVSWRDRVSAATVLYTLLTDANQNVVLEPTLPSCFGPVHQSAFTASCLYLSPVFPPDLDLMTRELDESYSNRALLRTNNALADEYCHMCNHTIGFWCTAVRQYIALSPSICTHLRVLM
jgi:hypothetical protein